MLLLESYTTIERNAEGHATARESSAMASNDNNTCFENRGGAHAARAAVRQLSWRPIRQSKCVVLIKVKHICRLLVSAFGANHFKCAVIESNNKCKFDLI
jgi:hypothetical protein